MPMVRRMTIFLVEDGVAEKQLPLAPRRGQEILTKVALKILFFRDV